jgi:hypothetical protein
MSTHKIIVDRPPARFRVTIESPSGKKETRWVDSNLAVTQICEEYGTPIHSVQWRQMK